MVDHCKNLLCIYNISMFPHDFVKSDYAITESFSLLYLKNLGGYIVLLTVNYICPPIIPLVLHTRRYTFQTYYST